MSFNLWTWRYIFHHYIFVLNLCDSMQWLAFLLRSKLHCFIILLVKWLEDKLVVNQIMFGQVSGTDENRSSFKRIFAQSCKFLHFCSLLNVFCTRFFLQTFKFNIFVCVIFETFCRSVVRVYDSVSGLLYMGVKILVC